MNNLFSHWKIMLCVTSEVRVIPHIMQSYEADVYVQICEII